jgi:iron complex transport system ATP-binding protein
MKLKKPLLTLTDVLLKRGETTVLSRFSWEIAMGEHWVLLGPNGSGKSSLMLMLQGMLWPRVGRISILGNEFGESDLSEMRRRVGFVGGDIEERFDRREKALDIILSGAVGTVGLQFDEPSAAQRKLARALVREMGLGPCVKKQFNHLSQGQKRMVCIARALMTRPRLLLLDEACAGLDPVAREMFLKKLKAVAKLPFRPGIMSATHHVEEIQAPFTHVLMLKQGRVFKAGPVKFVLNSSSMSSLFDRKLRVRKGGGRYCLS